MLHERRARAELRQRVAKWETERDSVEKSLRETNERLNLTLDNLPILAYEIDAEGRWLLSRGKGLEKLRRSPDDVVGESLFEHYKDVPAITQAVRGALKGQPQHIEVEVNGFIGDASYVPVFGASEKIERVYGTAMNITERKKAEEALVQSEEKYQLLYDNAPDMYVSVDPQTAMIVQCNHTLVTNVGYSKEEIIGRPVDVYHPDCMEDVHKAFESFVATGGVHDAELQLKRKDGTEIDVSLSVTAIRDARGNILYSNSVWRDITERKQAEHALQKAHDELEMKVQERTDGYLQAYNELQLEMLAREKTEEALRQREQELVRMERLRAVGELAGGISHNLNNILTGILGPSEPLKDMTEDPDVLQMAEIINSSARRASDLVQRLNLSVRDVAEDALESVPVNKVVQEAVQAVRDECVANLIVDDFVPPAQVLRVGSGLPPRSQRPEPGRSPARTGRRWGQRRPDWSWRGCQGQVVISSCPARDLQQGEKGGERQAGACGSVRHR